MPQDPGVTKVPFFTLVPQTFGALPQGTFFLVVTEPGKPALILRKGANGGVAFVLGWTQSGDKRQLRLRGYPMLTKLLNENPSTWVVSVNMQWFFKGYHVVESPFPTNRTIQ